MKTRYILGLALIGTAFILRSEKGKRFLKSADEKLSGFWAGRKHSDKIAVADFDTHVSIGNNSSFSVFGNN